MGQASLTRRAVIAGGAMAVTAAGAFAATPRHIEHRLARRKLGDLVARNIGPWQVAAPVGIVVTNEESQNTDGYDQLLTRVYEAPALPAMMLLIAYGSTQGGSLQLHRPETCYPGQGFTLDRMAEREFDFAGRDVQARQFTATRDSRVERLVYWTRIGNVFPLNTAQEYRAIITSVLNGVVPDGILVRVSTIGADGAVADRAMARFCSDMIASASPLGRSMLIGTA